MTSVLLVGEVAGDGLGLSSITLELLGAATRLAGDLGDGKVSCLLAGSDLDDIARSAVAAGANEVFIADDPGLVQYSADIFLPIVVQVAKETEAKVLLLGQTSLGRDLAPRLATRLNSAVAMDALSLEVMDDRIRVTRSCYGGNARQVVVVKTDPQVITVRAKSQDILQADPTRSGQITKIPISLADDRVSIVSTDLASADGARMEDAQIIIAGGRGLGDSSAFTELERIAGIMGAAVGASRAACDLGWYPPSQQVGLTGTVVSPDLYLAIAISGASQHMAGCSGSKNIVAINKDPDANIFRFCRFGIVEDYKNVLPELEEILKKTLAGN